MPDGDARPVEVARVRRAFEQVADQIRELILNGEIPPGGRLPTEAALASQFGVSRPTVREALRVLSAESLIRTTKGARGGSFVTVPTVDRITASLGANINLLSQSAEVTLEEFLELREFLEVPAAALAAERRDEQALERLRDAVPFEPLVFGKHEQFSLNRDFHSELVQATENSLLMIAAQPIFTVLQTHLVRSRLGVEFDRCVNEDHRSILEALEAGESDAAAAGMRAHLDNLRPMYERAWRFGRRPADSAASGISS